MQNQSVDLFLELTSFIIFIGLILINLGAVNNTNLLKEIIGKILHIIKNEYPNSNYNFFDYNNPYIKSLIDNKDTVIIEATSITETVNNIIDKPIDLNTEFDIILLKAGQSGAQLNYTLSETQNIINDISSFRDIHKKELNTGQLTIISKVLKKLRDYRSKIDKSTSN